MKKACMSTVKDPKNRNKKRRETLAQYAQRILKNTRESKDPDVIYWRNEIDKGDL